MSMQLFLDSFDLQCARIEAGFKQFRDTPVEDLSLSAADLAGPEAALDAVLRQDLRQMSLDLRAVSAAVAGATAPAPVVPSFREEAAPAQPEGA